MTTTNDGEITSPFLQTSPSDVAKARLQRAAEETGRTIEDLATCAVEEAALDWARSRGFPGEDKSDQHPARAAATTDQTAKHPIHDAIETAPEDDGER